MRRRFGSKPVMEKFLIALFCNSMQGKKELQKKTEVDRPAYV